MLDLPVVLFWVCLVSNFILIIYFVHEVAIACWWRYLPLEGEAPYVAVEIRSFLVRWTFLFLAWWTFLVWRYYNKTLSCVALSAPLWQVRYLPSRIKVPYVGRTGTISNCWRYLVCRSWYIAYNVLLWAIVGCASCLGT